MKNGFLKVSAISPDVFLADPFKNADEIIKFALKCSEDGVKILVTPELSLIGNTASDLILNKSLIDTCLDALNYIKNETCDLDILLAIGLPLSLNSKLFNVCAVVKNGEILGFVPKTNLENSEKRYFLSGENAPKAIQIENNFAFISPYHIFTDVTFNNLKIGITIGDEFSEVVPNTAILRENGVSLVLNLASHKAFAGSFDKLASKIEVYTKKYKVAYVTASSSNGESTTDTVSSGALIIAENGEILEKSNIFIGKNSIISEIDFTLDYNKEVVFKKEIQENFITFLVEETKLTRKFDKNPFLPKNTADYDTFFAEIVDIQTNALAHRLKFIGAKKAVINVSGGLDSTLALLITYKAVKKLNLPPENVISITLPGFGTTDRTYQNALNIMKGLGATVRNISIKESVLQHFKDINHDISDKSVVYENAQARERTQIGLDIANKENGLFVGTGDLSELFLGFATFAGDHIALYNPNGSIPKTLMQGIVGFLAKQDEFKNISVDLQDILNTPISPELLPTDTSEMNQKTEDIIGPYELHDFFAYHYIFNKNQPSKVYFMAKNTFNYEEKVIFKWFEMFIKRFYAQQYKRSCSCDGAKALEFSLSPRGDFLMPSDALFNADLTNLYSAKDFN